jgi:hypothetical protein
MKTFLEKKSGLAILFVLAGALMALLAMSPLEGKGGSLLLALLFWVAVVEGCIAAAAAGTMVNARWVDSVKRELFSVSPLLLLLSFLLLLLIPFVDTYPWAGQPGIWLRKEFFICRNLAFLLLAYVTAGWFAASAECGVRKKLPAAVYLFVFVVSQSLTAFDLVMSLEYPWVSTLLGGYFFIESIYGGFAVSAILCVLTHGKPTGAADPKNRSDLKDLAILMFGFSLLWAGLFFAQYLTIWYGNLPEEVSFIARRMSASPLRELSVAILFLLFFLPFPVLLPTRAKTNPYVVSAVSLLILSGILVERYVFLAPVVRIGGGALAADFLCLFFLFVFALYRGTRSMHLDRIDSP